LTVPFCIVGLLELKSILTWQCAPHAAPQPGFWRGPKRSRPQGTLAGTAKIRLHSD
jgi:hypothetical protein